MPPVMPVRGTHDVLPDDLRRHRHVEETARAVAARYGYQEMAIPIFEFTEVFARTLGETSDVVTKEMYSFADKGGDSITLRPEATAGVARAFISNGLAQQLPLKIFVRGPMFRYERPQKGRQRQFHQVDVELLGVPEPLGDAEIICLADDFLAALGLASSVRLELNTLGDAESRSAYRDRLVAYLADFRDRLSEDSRARLERNPLRILDSKDDGDRAIVANAPPMSDSLNDASRHYFDDLQSRLLAAGIDYKVNPKLVRGLDYYCHAAFEFVTDRLGAQGTVLAGGRYDGLIGLMGGPPTPGTGWAAGVERLSMLVEDLAAPARPLAMVPVAPEQETAAFALARRLRAAGHTVDMAYSGAVKRRMKRANRIGARAAVVLGEAELSRDAAVVRDMETGEQAEVPLGDLEAHLARFR